MKLKEAKSYLREFYQYPPQAQVFQENDIMLGVSFAVKAAREMGMPVSVCLGLGSSQGAHIGDSELSRYLNYINEDSQVSVSVAGRERRGCAASLYGRIGRGKESECGRAADRGKGAGIFQGVLGRSSG